MSLEPIIKNAARPGAVWLTSGFRGGGKTHTAVAIAEKMVANVKLKFWSVCIAGISCLRATRAKPRGAV